MIFLDDVILNVDVSLNCDDESFDVFNIFSFSSANRTAGVGYVMTEMK